MPENTEKVRLQWHPAFYSAAQLELIANKEDLIFESEHQLSRKPLSMDLLVIRKTTERPIANELGHLFDTDIKRSFPRTRLQHVLQKTGNEYHML